MTGMMNQSTLDFIHAHRRENVQTLALQGSRYPDVDMQYALEQIDGWQRACAKLPLWASTDGIVYPPHLSMEQCSSQFTASYKAQVAKRWVTDRKDTKWVDLTGGFGIDFSLMALQFPASQSVYVERQDDLCEVARHNFSLLGIKANIVCGDGVDYLHHLSHVSWLFLDPARRDAYGGKTVAIKDCTPDVLHIKEELLSKADVVLLKLSPMLDWHQALADLGEDHVRELHIVSKDNECKELLFVLSAASGDPMKLFCVNDDQQMQVDTSSDALVSFVREEQMQDIDYRENKLYLYEPNASIMKAGCFGALCHQYGVKAVGRNSHLFVSDSMIPDFPGRRFQIRSVFSLNKKSLKTALTGIEAANIAIRNFPLSVSALRKRLKLKDGGDHYLFGTTLYTHDHVLILCKKS
ncbi:MAG TPA: SAM-dependent methyltransferase [Prevotella sp.]|jgi:hypothetical protein|nr:SAM-dependent methyltransferase [Prevotella sp.]